VRECECEASSAPLLPIPDHRKPKASLCQLALKEGLTPSNQSPTMGRDGNGSDVWDGCEMRTRGFASRPDPNLD